LRVPTSTRTPLIGNPFRRQAETILRRSDDEQAPNSSVIRKRNQSLRQ
jgi:hypothetical protein